MKINHLLRKVVMFCITVFFLSGLVSCNKETEFDPAKGPLGKARYEVPEWLGGSSIKMLEDSSNYTIFLQLMEKAELREEIESQLFTLFVPNDDAFKAYFAKHGYASVDDLPLEEAERLFKLHFVTNSRSAYQLKYEYYWAELQGPNGEYASLFFRKQTSSTSIPYKEKVRYNTDFMNLNPNGEVMIYTENKLIPLMSKDFFEDYFGTLDGTDYLFMYPNSKWGDNLNWHNAMVTDPEVRTSSGFIYFIDQVVDNMESIEEYFIKHEDKYGVYYDLAQRFANYTVRRTMEDGETYMYKKSYDLIFNFAEERGPELESPRYFKGIWSIFVPTDEVLQEYLNTKLLNHYSSLDSVPEITLYYIVQTHISQSLALLSKFERNYFNAFGDVTDINRNDIVEAQMTSNGPFYGINKVLEPNVFTCVPGKLFFDNNYSTFLFALDQAEMISLVADLTRDVTLFAVSNDEMDAANIRYNSEDDVIETRDITNQWKTMNADALIEFLEDHIYEGVLDNLSGEGYIEMLSKNFVHYNNNQLEAGKNKALNQKATVVTKDVNDRNGILYTIDHAIRTYYTFSQTMLNDPETSEFANLMIGAGLLNPNFIDPYTKDTIPRISFISEADYWTAFIPTNDAMIQATAEGLIPADPDSLKDFISYHFIRKSTIFDDGNLSGDFTTNSIQSTTGGIIYHKVKVDNAKNNLSVTDGAGNKVTVSHANANSLVRSGVMHKITTVLKK